MKKSRIIIPALAMIAFSVAASIAGTVAWFTASRTAQINAGTYAVVKTSAELKCVLSNGVGTTVSDSTVSLNGNLLSDGSFSHKSSKVYTPNSEGTALDTEKGEIPLSDAQLATKLQRGTTGTPAKTIYTAVTFNMAFTVSFGAIEGDIGLYLDNGAGKSSFTVDGGADPITAKGFRMAIVPSETAPEGSATRATVFADLQEFAKCHYIGGTSDTFLSGTAYASADNDLVDSAYNAALPTSATERSEAIARPDYLGYFGYKANSQVTLNYTVVAWFEGTDENIINRATAAEYQAVVAKLNFEAVNLKAGS